MTTPLTAHIARHQGLPWIHINGKPFDGRIYMRAMERYPGYDRYGWDEVLRDYRLQAENGAGMFMFHSSCASDFYERLWGDVWTTPDTYDYSHLDRFMEFFRSQCPGVLTLPKLNMFLPTWWEDQHPDDIQRFADGRTRAAYAGESAAFRDRVVSLASEAWYADMTRCLERYLDYAEAHYGEIIAGYLICGGITHEWGILGSFDFVDYSPPMQRYWRSWVGRRYPGRPPYPAEAIPSPEQRLAAAGDYRNPAESQAAIDFQLCLSDLVAERIVGFCETVKRRTVGRKLAATYYGYTLTCREGGLERQGQFLGRYGCGGFQGGHLAMAKVLASPAVDMITSPFSYANRRLGTGDVQPHYAETSVVRAGKVSLLQDDNRCWKGYAQKGVDTGYYPEPENFIRQLRRSFARRLCGDDVLYYMDLLGGNYDDPRVLAELRHEQELFLRYADRRSPSRAELLVVVDETAIAYLSLDSGLQMRNVYRQAVEWARCGVPYHVVLAGTAATMDLSPYRLAIMTNTVLATPSVADLAARCRREGRSLLFLPGGGMVGPCGPDARAARDLVGVAPDGNRIAVRDRTGAPGFDALSAEAPLGWDALGTMAERAGCHRYSRQGERIWRSGRLLAVHANEGGALSLRLPAGDRVAEIVAGTGPWLQEGDRLDIVCDTGDTAILVLQPSTPR